MDNIKIKVGLKVDENLFIKVYDSVKDELIKDGEKYVDNAVQLIAWVKTWDGFKEVVIKPTIKRVLKEQFNG